MKPIKRFCSNCKNETNQNEIFKESFFDIGEAYFNKLKGKPLFMIQAVEWSVTKCLGCEKLNLCVKTRNQPDQDPFIINFPKKAKKDFPKWIFALDWKYLDLVSEMYKAYNEGLLILATMGVRSVLDIFITDKIGDVGTFEKKLDKLCDEGFISTNQKENLSICIEAGNAANHRQHKPDEKTVGDLLDVVEHLLKEQLISANLKQLKGTIPRRKKK